MEKTIDDLREEQENRNFEAICSGISNDLRRQKALNEGKINYYFKLCKITGIEPEEQVIETYPEEYNIYCKSSQHYQEKYPKLASNKKSQIPLYSKEFYLNDLNEFIKNSINQNIR